MIKSDKLLLLHKYVELLENKDADPSLTVNFFNIRTKAQVERILKRHKLTVKAFSVDSSYHSGNLFFNGVSTGYIYTNDDTRRFNIDTENYFKQFEVSMDLR